MPSVAGLSAPGEREPVIRPVPPRPPQQGTERRPATFEVPTPDFPSPGISIEAVQVFLDVVSVTSIPIASEVAGLVSGVIYTLQGGVVGAALSGVGIVPGIGTVADVSRTGLAARAVGAGAADAAKGIRHGPLNPGPLADDIAATFRGGSYVARTLDQPIVLYRVIGDRGNPTGSFWTATEPHGPLQSVVDLALDQNWGNPATQVIRAQIPAGTTVYEGAAAAQRGLVGGGHQVYIPRVDPRWRQ